MKSYSMFRLAFYAFIVLGNAMIFAAVYFWYWPFLLITIPASVCCYIARIFYAEAKANNL